LVRTPRKKRKKTSKESSGFGGSRCKLGSEVVSYSRIQFASNESKLVPTGFGPWDPPNPKRPLTRDVKLGGYG